MARRELPPGTLVHGRYRVERMLGSGGFGITYLAADLREHRAVAMKEYMPLDAAYRVFGSREVRPTTQGAKQYEKFRQKFLDEAQIIYKFRGHPNIVEVRHLFCENGTAYYVMEYIEGMDLDKFLASRGGRLSWAALRPVVAQVVSALRLIHGENMVHCDISPDNIFLVRGQQVKLLDFGAARTQLRGSSHASVILAKCGYTPPEQLRGQNLGPWTDIYALAVTIYHCITGGLPPKAEDRLVQDKTRWPSQMGLAVPSPQWEQALKRAMAVRAEERYQRITDFWDALNAGTPPTRSAADTPPPGRGLPVLEGIRGRFAGQRLVIRQETCLGTDARCPIGYPPGSPGISRMHLRLWQENGTLFGMDLGSAQGSRLDGRPMTPGLAYAIPPGTLISLGDTQLFRTAESG